MVSIFSVLVSQLLFECVQFAAEVEDFREKVILFFRCEFLLYIGRLAFSVHRLRCITVCLLIDDWLLTMTVRALIGGGGGKLRYCSRRAKTVRCDTVVKIVVDVH